MVLVQYNFIYIPKIFLQLDPRALPFNSSVITEVASVYDGFAMATKIATMHLMKWTVAQETVHQNISNVPTESARC